MRFYLLSICLFIASSIVLCKLPSAKKRFDARASLVGQVDLNSLKEDRVFSTRYENRKFLNVLSKENDKGVRELTYYGQMVAGATARSISATAIHPLNVIKTMLQCRNAKMPELKWNVLWRGSGAQLVMSIPHGAFNFAVTETTKSRIIGYIRQHPASKRIPQRVLDPLLDFLASAFATFICSAISTPQMVITDRIMSGMYSNLFTAIYGIATTDGIGGFYVGWLPAIAQKIPSYALTWMLFQQFKTAFYKLMDRAGTTPENTALGALASSVACSIMIPLDTIKTRIVTQRPGTDRVYEGIVDCFEKILKAEGPVGFYRALPPRLMAVVPMTGLQYGVYELMKRLIVGLPPPKIAKAEALRRLKLQQQASSSGSE